MTAEVTAILISISINPLKKTNKLALQPSWLARLLMVSAASPFKEILLSGKCFQEYLVQPVTENTHPW
ncbi:hypothetical protein CH54_386 [Yersinia rochesterensis]|uniref:Uncharacterized protein n=1 Tax=Yersinia rochesterensis TaxID=1604335 RepID=A0ABN4FFC7_9GAMM|nr:hypothetical protein DJ57_1240 [Yersinia rochesterensis]AJI88934.1 hypothetical protein AW19_1276 [Yersinia frederiksenii Y225]AJJ36071.1 hypothetical protein CH54_386 [Yersinia rochesterensis]CNH35442.1 Uncharacterised protein [Yersinia kristensenii]CRY63895.1 Uncharacterised protein [Yersinia kristensenii]